MAVTTKPAQEWVAGFAKNLTRMGDLMSIINKLAFGSVDQITCVKKQ